MNLQNERLQEDILCQKESRVMVFGNGGACTKWKRMLILKDCVMNCECGQGVGMHQHVTRTVCLEQKTHPNSKKFRVYTQSSRRGKVS